MNGLYLDLWRYYVLVYTFIHIIYYYYVVHCCFQGKLIKLFGKQLVTKAKLKLDELPSELVQFPKIQQWLKVVGIRPNSLQVR